MGGPGPGGGAKYGYGFGVISGAGEVSVVAHRVVHGGEKFTEGTLITDEVLALAETLGPDGELVPDERTASARFPNVPGGPYDAVFDPDQPAVLALVAHEPEDRSARAQRIDPRVVR